MIEDLKKVTLLAANERQTRYIAFPVLLGDDNQTPLDELITRYRQQPSHSNASERDLYDMCLYGKTFWYDYWHEQGVSEQLIAGDWTDVQEYAEKHLQTLIHAEIAAVITYPNLNVSTIVANGCSITADLFIFHALMLNERGRDWVTNVVNAQKQFGNDFRPLLKKMAVAGLVPSWSY